MPDKTKQRDEIGRAQSRWACVGPYYAMFPMKYVGQVIREHTAPGDAVLDPFAGRFSVPAVASYLERRGCGVEISPLGWLYGRVKLAPAQRCGDVLRRLDDMHNAASEFKHEAKQMDEFFNMCYCEDVLRFLYACRKRLDWQKSQVDATLMAIIMVSLHHGIGRGLSNQMRQAKSMSPRYSVNWWKAKGMTTPPKVDAVGFLRGRIRRRYQYGAPCDKNSKAMRGDSCKILKSARMKNWHNDNGSVKLLFTSPPYWSLVNYFKDQWLRLWMLGGEPSPAMRQHAYEKGFYSKEEYHRLIETVFARCAPMMRPDGVIVVRMHASPFTRQTILDALGKCFPNHRKMKKPAITKCQTQTVLYNNGALKNAGEQDIVLVPS
ncbi:MAG: DNA methyltransferase [Gammaproteobacteria bacterium]